MNELFIDHGVTEKHKCKFNGACFGEICICNEICLKDESELTEDEKNQIEEINKAMGE